MRAALVLLAFAGGCSSDDTAPLNRCPFGDPAAPAQIEIIHLDAQSAMVDSTAGAQIPLGIPPQGGWAVLLGVRATNLDGCQMNLTTSFRDVSSPSVLKIDSRPSQPLVNQGDGWGVTPLADFSNLQLCPAPVAQRNLYNETYRFTVTVDDIDGKTASQDIELVPTCPADDPRCACECDQDYVVGAACPTP